MDMNFDEATIRPKDYSETQIHRTINYLIAENSLEELRHVQSLIIQQQKIANEQKNDNALANLQVMEKITSAAIDKKEFGEE
jgi:hypothetical protein